VLVPSRSYIMCIYKSVNNSLWFIVFSDLARTLTKTIVIHNVPGVIFMEIPEVPIVNYNTSGYGFRQRSKHYETNGLGAQPGSPLCIYESGGGHHLEGLENWDGVKAAGSTGVPGSTGYAQ